LQEVTDNPEPKVKWSWKNADLAWLFSGAFFALLAWFMNRVLSAKAYSGTDPVILVLLGTLLGIAAPRSMQTPLFADDPHRRKALLFLGLYSGLCFGNWMQLVAPRDGMWMIVVNVVLSGAMFGLLQAVFAVNAPSEIRALFEEQTIFDRDDVVARLGRIWPFATLAVYPGLMIVTRSPLVAGLACASMLCFSPRIRRFRGTDSWQQRARVVEGARLITVITLIAANIAALVR